ncbi:hypothetical protein [Rhodococcus sp. A14]|uniref:hypothetical protein n=1 Tax=Rhodococcus sp. A14 TaxID=1194106 RepID=UPI0014230815|nr:hypothetical protein [Rhodococcus sp. A14]
MTRPLPPEPVPYAGGPPPRVTIVLEYRRAQQRREAAKAARMARLEEWERRRRRLRDAKVVYLSDHHYDRPSE